MLACYSTLRYRSFLDGKNGLSCAAIEGEDQTHLGGLNNSGDAAAVADQIGESRLRRQVIVPHVMVDQLLVPPDGPGCGIERDQGVCVQIVAFTLAAVEVRARRASRYVDEAQIAIGGQRRPGICRPGARRLFCVPSRLQRVLRLPGNRVPTPSLGP